MVALTSLFVYPGVGHFMVRAPKKGLLFGALFSLGLGGIVMEMWIMLGPLLKAYSGEALTISSTPVKWGRIVFWFLATTALWLGGAWDAFGLAKGLAAESESLPQSEEEAE